MKKALILIVCLMGMALTSKAQNSTAFQPGPMSVIGWDNQMTVGGAIIEKELWDRYLSPADLKDFKSGRTLNTVGGVITMIGSWPMGYGLGYMLGTAIAGNSRNTTQYQTAKNMFFIGTGIVAVGLALGIPGSVKMKRAIKNYNMSLTYQPKLQFGTTENGIGLAYKF